MKVVLKIVTNENVNEIPLDLYGSIVVGRSSSSDHKIPDELMSAKHCKFILGPSKLEVYDLDSKNGTYLNGIRVDQSDVFIGDELKIGGTKVSLSFDKMDQAGINFLTFPGENRERLGHELRLDFTSIGGVSNYRPRHSRAEGFTPMMPVREMISERKARSKIRLSKEEIRHQNKVRTSMASTIDLLLILFAIALPLVLINFIMMANPTSIQSHRASLMLSTEVLFVGMYFIMNFKIFKFSLGEKFAGIEKLYLSQD